MVSLSLFIIWNDRNIFEAFVGHLIGQSRVQLAGWKKTTFHHSGSNGILYSELRIMYTMNLILL